MECNLLPGGPKCTDWVSAWYLNEKFTENVHVALVLCRSVFFKFVTYTYIDEKYCSHATYKFEAWIAIWLQESTNRYKYLL